MRRVVVTGYGAVTALGETAGEAWASIMNGAMGYSRLSFDNPDVKAKFYAFVPESKARYKAIPKAIQRCLPRFAKNAVVAAREALEMAFGDPGSIADNYAPHDCGVIIGTGWGGIDQSNDIHIAYLETGFGNPFGSLITMPSVATGACSLLWNLRGYQNTVNAACATGTIAIGDAFEIIRSGRARMMLAGGSETLVGETNVWNIDVLNALSKEQTQPELACCPFDRRRSGFVLAEGAAVVCLEEYEHAVHRGARILGEITGYGNYSDACDFTAPAEDMASRVRSIERALIQANVKPAQIGYINAHGTSTPLNDLNETNSIKKAFGDVAWDIPVSSTKSYSGHLISAAGSFETIICLKALETGTLPGTRNLNDPDPECDLNYLANGHVQADVDRALNLSFGFGGANAALVIERVR